jgi:beta-mannosidase
MPPPVKHELHTGWHGRQARRAPAARGVEDFDADVPGCVHTDLIAAGVIPDPFPDCNEADVAWVAACDWQYRMTFGVDAAASAHEQVDLVFDGLDTVASIELNGSLIGETANMHRSYRFAVTDLVVEGDNQLDVTFVSATEHCEALREKLGVWPSSSFGRPFNYVRKMACSWGWDWGPWLTTAGIWRPVTIHAWSTARLAGVRPEITVDEDDAGRVVVHVVTTRSPASASSSLVVRAALRDPAGVPVCDASCEADAAGDCSIDLDPGVVRRWWPHSHGDQPLYQLDVDLLDADGAVLDSWSRRVGFRKVELDTSADAIGSAFTFVVNGRPIFARGVNWIPDDMFPSRVGRDQYRQRLLQAKSANVDMIRVWGGGIYEDDEFYDACDELGLLVWQDLLFACAAYPEELLHDEVEAEARENVARLMTHPSLALWNGNNENIWGYFDWDWQRVLDGRTWGAGFYFDLLPSIVADTDPTANYWPGSPYSGSMDIDPNADAHGCKHVWDVWNKLDASHYRDHDPRFVAEFGWQGPPTWHTLTESISERPLSLDSPAMRNHQKATDGDLKLARGVAALFGEVEDFDAWWFATQLVQARAVKTGIEHFRSLRGTCMGTIWWQLNDCWPAVSWSLIDSSGRPKPAWYALREVYRPRLVTVQPRGESLALCAVNDSRDDWRVEGVVRRLRLDGSTVATMPVHFTAMSSSTVVAILDRVVSDTDDPTREMIVAEVGDERAWWWFCPDHQLPLVHPSLRATATADGDDLVIDVTTDVLVRDLVIVPDRLEAGAGVDRQVVSLLPGETARFRVTGLVPRDVPALLERPSCWSVADLVIPR